MIYVCFQFSFSVWPLQSFCVGSEGIVIVVTVLLFLPDIAVFLDFSWFISQVLFVWHRNSLADCGARDHQGSAGNCDGDL